VLQFTANPALIAANSGNVTVTAPPVTQLNYQTQPSSAAQNGQAFAQQPVILAQDGREAAIASAREALDLVLIDLQMPELDGETATRAIRADERGRAGARHVPIVGVTADAVDLVRRRCLDAGMDDHLTKPIDPDELQAALERWTRTHGNSELR